MFYDLCIHSLISIMGDLTMPSLLYLSCHFRQDIENCSRLCIVRFQLAICVNILASLFSSGLSSLLFAYWKRYWQGIFDEYGPRDYATVSSSGSNYGAKSSMKPPREEVGIA